MVSYPTFHDYRSSLIVVQTFPTQLNTGAEYVSPCQRRRGIEDFLFLRIDILEAEERKIACACGHE